jgi:hypothetical protein
MRCIVGMDWFFNQYSYGTALPSYNMTSTVSQDTALPRGKFLETLNGTPPKR